MAADIEGFSAVVSTVPQVTTIPVQIANVKSATGQSSGNAKTEDISPNNGKPLSVIFSSDEIREDGRGSVSLAVRRDPRDVETDLLIRVVGGNRDQLQIPSTIKIPAGQSDVVIRVIPINDSVAEMPLMLNYTFSAAQHQAVVASIQLIDDEAPKFQNPASRFDVNDDGITSALDALQIINALSKRSDAVLDPRSEKPEGIYYDVNGDYRIGALDALNIINSLARSQASTLQRFERDVAAIDRVDSRYLSAGGEDKVAEIGSVGFAEHANKTSASS